MTECKTEFTTMEEHDSQIRQAIARRAFELYEAASFHHGNDEDHWRQAEQELTMQSSDLTVEGDGFSLVIQVPMETEKKGQILASISPRSVLLFTISAKPIMEVDDATELRKLVRYISLPEEVIPEQVITSFDHGGLTLRLPILSASMAVAQSA